MTSREMALEIVKQMQNQGWRTDVVNDIEDADSIVEHEVDVDVIVDSGHIFNITINVTTMGHESDDTQE